MYPAMLLIPLIYALILGAIAFAPGLLALCLAFATRTTREEGCLGTLHGLSTTAAALFLAISFGFVATGLFSVVFNVFLVVIALIWYEIAPMSEVNADGGVARTLYLGVMFLVFLGLFAIAMDRLVRWLKPKGA